MTGEKQGDRKERRETCRDRKRRGGRHRIQERERKGDREEKWGNRRG